MVWLHQLLYPLHVEVDASCCSKDLLLEPHITKLMVVVFLLESPFQDVSKSSCWRSGFSRSTLHNMFTASTRPVRQHKDPHSWLTDWWHKDCDWKTCYRNCCYCCGTTTKLPNHKGGHNDVMTPSSSTHTHTGYAQCFISLFRKLLNTTCTVTHREQLTFVCDRGRASYPSV